MGQWNGRQVDRWMNGLMHGFTNYLLGRASVPASPNFAGDLRKIGLAGTLALPSNLPIQQSSSFLSNLLPPFLKEQVNRT
jgi:hypothetical protein